MVHRKQLVTDLMAQFATIKRLSLGGHGQMMSQFELTRPQLGVLMLLELYRSLSVGRIAELMGISNGAATQTLDIMVRRDLIGRTADPQDRRVVYLGLTPAGQKLADEVHEQATKRMAGLMVELSDDELSQFVATMSKLSAAMEQNTDNKE